MRTICLAWIIVSTLLVSGASRADETLKTVKVTVPRASVFVLSYFGARDAGIFKKHGIDIQIDTRAFPAFIASLPGRETLVGTYAGFNGIQQMNQGKDLVVIGGGLTVMQDVFVRKDSPVQTITDLKGKRFGVFSTGAGAARSLRVIMIDGFGIDYMKDATVVEVAPPALFALLGKGDVDSMFNISSLTIRAASQPDKYRSIFSPNDYWREKTGVPLLWSAPIIAWRDWVEEDRDRAKNLVEALHESWRWLREHSDEAIKKYGALAAVKTPEEAATYKKMLQQKSIFLPEWNAEIVDAQWKFLETARKVGVLDRVPSKEKHALILR